MDLMDEKTPVVMLTLREFDLDTSQFGMCKACSCLQPYGAFTEAVLMDPSSKQILGSLGNLHGAVPKILALPHHVRAIKYGERSHRPQQVATKPSSLDGGMRGDL